MSNGNMKIIETSSADLSQEKGRNKLYKHQDDSTSGKISDMIAERMLILDNVIKNGKTNLKNLDEVQSVSLCYLESCRRADVLPTFEGLCSFMGYSRQWLYMFLKTHADSPVSEYLDELRTVFADMMTTASLKRYVDCATTIFSLKNMSGLGYSDKGDAVPDMASAQLDEKQTISEYRMKYKDLLEE